MQVEQCRDIIYVCQETPPFARMNADPAVMEFFPACLTRDESDKGIEWLKAHFGTHGYSMLAAELLEGARFIGFIGIQNVPFEAPFTPAIEIGWRIARPFWNRGLATEGATAIVSHGFRQLALTELVAFTVPANMRSRRVMEKIGMKQDRSGDFDHPKLPREHPLSRHVLYRLRKEDWLRAAASPEE
jgi:RimJ/RimL family protein N-acetyltransferase